MSNAIRALFSSVNGAPNGRPAPVVHRVPSVRPIPVARNLTTQRFLIAVSSRRARSSHLLAPAVLPAAMAAVIGTAALLRGRYLWWGTTDEEQDRALAGDDLLPAVDQSTTRAITINAAAQDIWPWIVQLGQGRGGFNSYDWLENRVARIDIHNADRIVPEWQQIAVGAEVRLAPEVRLRVAALEPRRALVLRGSVPMGQVAPPYEFTWAFVLVPQPDDTTRLVVRERYKYTHRCRDDRPTGATRQLPHEPENAARYQDPGRADAHPARAERLGAETAAGPGRPQRANTYLADLTSPPGEKLARGHDVRPSFS